MGQGMAQGLGPRSNHYSLVSSYKNSSGNQMCKLIFGQNVASLALGPGPSITFWTNKFSDTIYGVRIFLSVKFASSLLTLLAGE